MVLNILTQCPLHPFQVVPEPLALIAGHVRTDLGVVCPVTLHYCLFLGMVDYCLMLGMEG